MEQMEVLLEKSMDILGQIALEEDFFKRARHILEMKETILDMQTIVYNEKRLKGEAV